MGAAERTVSHCTCVPQFLQNFASCVTGKPQLPHLNSIEGRDATERLRPDVSRSCRWHRQQSGSTIDKVTNEEYDRGARDGSMIGREDLQAFDAGTKNGHRAERQ